MIQNKRYVIKFPNIPVVAAWNEFLKYLLSPLDSKPRVCILKNSRIEVTMLTSNHQPVPALAPHPKIPALIPAKIFVMTRHLLSASKLIWREAGAIRFKYFSFSSTSFSAYFF